MSDPVATLLREGTAKRLKKGVVPKSRMWGGIELGDAIEVELCSGHVIRWRARPKLFWNKAGKYLGLAEGFGRADKRAATHFDTPGMPQDVPNLFRDFHGRDARARKSWLDVKLAENWVGLGPVCRLDYFSTKKGRRTSYTHKHGRGVKLYRFGGPTRAVWVIKGGALTVTGRGIIN